MIKSLCVLCLLSLFSCDKHIEVQEVKELSQVQKTTISRSNLRPDLKKTAEKLINDKVFLEFDKNYSTMRKSVLNKKYDFSKLDKGNFDKKKDKIKNIDDWVDAYKGAGAKGDVKAFVIENIVFMKTKTELLIKYPELQNLKANEFAELYFAISTNKVDYKKDKNNNK